jgi:hypothetical protein
MLRSEQMTASFGSSAGTTCRAPPGSAAATSPCSTPRTKSGNRFGPGLFDGDSSRSVEHLCTAEVRGSNPLGSTSKNGGFVRSFWPI